VVNQVKNIAVFLWCGHHNFGDDLFIESYKTLFPECNIKIFTDAPNKTYPTLHFRHINEYDLFILGGGELINADRLFIPPSWSKYIKIPKIILGCGVNAETAQQLSPKVVNELKNFAYIGLRDQTAVNILQQIPAIKNHVDLFYDLAYSLNIKKSLKQPLQNTAVVIPTDRVSNKADLGIQNFNLHENSYSWLKTQLEPFDNATFLPFGIEDNNDYETCRLLSSCSRNPTITPHNFIQKEYVFNTIANASHVITYRLHGMILSHILNTPYTFYPYHWKLNRVHETIKNKSPTEIRNEQQIKIKTIVNVLAH
jgi:exopolysaccharide biosynthesis predicted pyruvyltransferase EpsI